MVAPSSSSLRLCRRSPLGFPLASDAFGVAGFRRVPSCPGGSCLLLPRPRYESQVAPRSVPPALPVIDRRVASILSPSAVPVVKAPGCPFALRPRYRRRSASESPQMLILRSRLTSVPSRLGVPCHPVALFESPDCSVDSLQTSSIDQSPSRPGSCSLNVADSVRSESPRNFLPRLIRICFRRLRLLPHVRLCR
jgi:hypothetical protein